jgi:hypothetical protein
MSDTDLLLKNNNTHKLTDWFPIGKYNPVRNGYFQVRGAKKTISSFFCCKNPNGDFIKSFWYDLPDDPIEWRGILK